MSIKLIAPALAVFLFAASARSTTLAAQTGSGSTVNTSLSTAAIYRVVLNSFGLQALRNYRFDPRPACPVDSANRLCKRHPRLAENAVRAIASVGVKEPHLRFTLSPVRDSLGHRIVDLVLTNDSLDETYGTVEGHRFELGRDGARVLSKKIIYQDMFVRPRR